MQALRGSWVLVVVALTVAVIAVTRPDECAWGTFSYSVSGPGGTENTDLAVWREGREARVTRDGLAARSTLSPDGRRVAYESAAGGSHSDTVGYSRLAIHVADVDGANRAALTTGRHDEKPAWAPDGTKVLFLRDRGVWTVDPATKDEELVYEPAATGADVVDATWPGDSSRIGFLVRGESRDEGTELWVVDADGSDPRRLLSLEEWTVNELAWSPRGDAFAWTVFEGEVGEVFLMPAVGGAPRPIAAAARTPLWSDDGERLAYVATGEGRDGSGAFVADAAGRNPEAVPDAPQHVHDWVSCAG